MTQKLSSVLVLVCLSLFLAVRTSAEETKEKFPFQAVVTADDPNLRSGPNINFEVLSRLKKDQKVVVVERSFDWYKIKLPSDASAFISEKFLKPRTEDIGMVTGNRVNIRCGAGEKFTIIGKAPQGLRVRIREHVSGWFRIEPAEGMFGWVDSQFISFQSLVIPQPVVIIEPSRNIYRKAAKPPEPPKIQEPPLFSVVGRVEDIGRIVSSKDVRYKIVVDGKTTYLLEGDRTLFDRLVGYTIKVEGNLKPDPQKRFPHPVISVIKINTIL